MLLPGINIYLKRNVSCREEQELPNNPLWTFASFLTGAGKHINPV